MAVIMLLCFTIILTCVGNSLSDEIDTLQNVLSDSSQSAREKLSRPLIGDIQENGKRLERRTRRSLSSSYCRQFSEDSRESKVCTSYYSKSEQRKSGGGWWRSTRITYVTKYYSTEECCPGYRSTGGYSSWRRTPSNCKPACHGNPDLNSCNRNEGEVIHKNGTIIRCSGGACMKPDTCRNCNEGYYADNVDGYCRACKSINHCNIPRCSDGTVSYCVWCEGQIIDNSPGFYAYTQSQDKTKCLETCSWRKGVRCYPGTCSGKMLVSQCNCSDGYGGDDCATFTAKDQFNISSVEVVFERDVHPKLILSKSQYPEMVAWTNIDDWSNVSFVMPTTLKVPGISAESREKQTYINFNKTKIGIEKIWMTSVLRRGQQQQIWEESKYCSFQNFCKLNKTGTPIRFIKWNDILQGGYPTPFNHKDSIQMTFLAKNGGQVFYTNRERENREEYYYIKGTTVSTSLELNFDFYPPSHCRENEIPCLQQPLITPDFIKEPSFNVTWEGWSDLDSGIHKLHFQVVPLKVIDAKSGILTTIGTPSFTSNVNASEVMATLNVTKPGPYYVEMSVIDRAENEKPTRRILLFDDESEVTLTGEAIIVKTAEKLTGYKWINHDSPDIEVVWSNRFINERHHKNSWLNEVAPLDHVAKELDDTLGMSNRTTARIKNIQGIVKFTIGYDIRYDLINPAHTVDQKAVPPDAFDNQRITIKENLKDGKRLTFYVRGFDVMGSYCEDNTTVTIDLSPPVIQNMWLTRGDMVNITVHSEEELNQMTFEWEAFDEHSGLDKISWRIFDNYTQSDILHGLSFEPPQGETRTLEECEQKYANFSRGPKCYCTPFNGCYHQHFSIKPAVVTTKEGGLLSGMQSGRHERDYFIEVTAVNTALLTTVSVIKVTIDISPPHEGTVHDGFDGQPEVDFQQSFTLSSYWNGFFDKESGVWFYMYGYAKSCLDKSVFDIGDSAYSTYNNSLTKTYSTAVHFTVEEPGTYFVTVAAFNHALDPSSPVCSDGVTVDTSEAKISNVEIKGAITRPGLVRNSQDRVWLLKRKRVLVEIAQPSKKCIDKATSLDDEQISVIPFERKKDGSIYLLNSTFVCESYGGVDPQFTTFITSDVQLEISWNVTDVAVAVHDFEVGLSSHNTSADIMPLTSSLQHQHIRLRNPNIWDGERFFIVIRSTSKAAVKHDTVIGPFVVDTTKPDFHGKILVTLEQSDEGFQHLIASWSQNAFEDHGDPSQLSFEVAVGSLKYGRDVLPFQKLSPGCSCKVPINCTAINIDRLKWHLHGHQRYYVTIKASNSIGLFTLATSDEYIHDVELPSAGVVFDVDSDTKLAFQDIDDIDFQSKTTQLSASWAGFEHPHLNITYTVCIKSSNSSSYLECSGEISETEYTFSSVNLNPFKTYYQEVIAKTAAGNITVSSDGVTIVSENSNLEKVFVFDGVECQENLNSTYLDVLSHHVSGLKPSCKNDIDFQASTNELHAYWTVPSDITFYTPDAYIAILERAPIADVWTLFHDYEHIKTTNHTKFTTLSLMPGRRYKMSLKLCAASHCFNPVQSDGVSVISRPPLIDKITTSYNNITNKVVVEFDAFRDPDIEDPDESREVMDYYEWAFTDNSHHGNLVTKWQRANIISQKSSKVSFEIYLNTSITFSKCWKVSVRGYTFAGLSAVISTEIRNCSNIHQVRPRVVLDAVGSPVYSKSHIVHEGQMIRLKKNAAWIELDREYTPYTNVISAVWPDLRYPEYEWAVLEVQDEDPTMFYHSDTADIIEPCNHPDAIKCGYTGDEFMNAVFARGELSHGKRYKVCIHANSSKVSYEKWTLELDSLSACSDGITVDITPPVPGTVWIGRSDTDLYQTSSVCLTVNWKSFIDVEEGGQTAHASGITSYRVAIGSAHGGNDIVDFVNVGLTNHYMFHGLHLENGHTYYASVRADDFTHQEAESISKPITVDTSPPDLTGSPITLDNRHITETISVSACWKNVFRDRESGISHYEWAVGSRRGHDDKMHYTFTTSECSQSDESQSLGLQEGHAYYVSVKAYNNAGLYTLAVSWAFVVDTSSPTKGNVYDGPRAIDGASNDIDFLTNASTIEAHWGGFYEPHGTIKEYTVHVGSCAGCDDILRHQSVGVTEGIVLSKLHLSEGQMVYVTVSACNSADLCTSSTSDGVLIDQTPPVAGHVLDGIDGIDMQYQSSRIYLGAKWYGFTDAQSEISHFVWRAGTNPGEDDILMATDVHKATEAFIIDLLDLTGKPLPIGVRIFITVRAYNKAGLFSEATSNGFIVDVTGPVFSKQIAHKRIGSAKPETSVLPSLIHVEWDVVDEESYIDAQYLSIVSHIGGDFNSSSIKVEGIVRDYTLSDLALHDGSKYCVMLISCNRAGLCTESKLQHILMDSTHPTPGMFAINTDHSAQLDRQPEDWMTWAAPYVKLAWLGFEDVHSGIDRYLINIGSTFMGNDLHKVSSDPHIVHHNNSGIETNEGKIQVEKIWTKSLSKLESVFVSIWAVNGVGLSSPVIHHEFDLAFGGMMVMVRRCVAKTCLGHCVCAPHGQLCSTNTTCSDQLGDLSRTTLEVKDFTDITFPLGAPVINHSPVNTLSAAKWTLSEDGKRPIWYEWSVGYTMYDNPKGVFDVRSDQVWHCGGHNMSWIMSHPKGRNLKEKLTYSFFIRAWFSENTYTVYKSPGVMVYTTTPKALNVQGKMVKEALQVNSKDVDFVDVNSNLIVDWNGRFSNNDQSLTRFHLYISTYPGGHDTFCIAKNIPASKTSFNVTGYKFEENTVYYSVVQAYNMAGLHSVQWSDGFLIDNRPPTVGIVHDGEVFADVHAFNSSHYIPSFWNGFMDSESGIASYNVCVSTVDSRIRCNVFPATNVGLHNFARLYPTNNVKDGSVITSEVQAFDYIGHRSARVRSNGAVIDASPPERLSNLAFAQSVVKNPSFENVSSAIYLEELNRLRKCISNPPVAWEPNEKSCILSVTSNKSKDIPDGKIYVVIKGGVKQNLHDLHIGSKYRLTFYISHVPVEGSMISTGEGVVELNNERHVFLLYHKPELSPERGDVAFELTWHKHELFFEVKSQEGNLSISTSGKHCFFAVDNVVLEEQISQHSEGESEASGHVKVHTIFIHDFSAVYASWNTIDEESGIVEYLWAIGTSEGGTQLQPYYSTGRRSFAYTYSLHLVHNTIVYVTVVAVNGAGLRTVSFSEAIRVDLTPPLFAWIRDGPVRGEDIDFQRSTTVSVNWEVNDIESGIESCEVEVVNSHNGQSLVLLSDIEHDLRNASFQLNSDAVVDSKIKFTVICKNNAGLTARSTSNGIEIISRPPSADQVVLEVLCTSITQYPVHSKYHGDKTQIRFSWTGFEIGHGIDSFLVMLDGHNFHAEELVEGTTNGISFASFTNLTLKDGNYNITVIAINQLDMYSEKRIADFILYTAIPELTGRSVSSIWDKYGRTLKVDWNGVFRCPHELYYEVTVSWEDGGDGDIVQWEETTQTQLLIKLDVDDIQETEIYVRISVRAITPAGFFENSQSKCFISR